MEGDFADVRFRITDEATGKPVQRLAPGAWMDMGEVIRDREGGEQKSCKEKIALYLKGVVGIRPMIDLNSYYVVVLNHDASVSILDPTVSMVGRTSTLAQVRLPAPGHGLGAQRRRQAPVHCDADLRQTRRASRPTPSNWRRRSTPARRRHASCCSRTAAISGSATTHATLRVASLCSTPIR